MSDGPGQLAGPVARLRQTNARRACQPTAGMISSLTSDVATSNPSAVPSGVDQSHEPGAGQGAACPRSRQELVLQGSRLGSLFLDHLGSRILVRNGGAGELRKRGAGQRTRGDEQKSSNDVRHSDAGHEQRLSPKSGFPVSASRASGVDHGHNVVNDVGRDGTTIGMTWRPGRSALSVPACPDRGLDAQQQPAKDKQPADEEADLVAGPVVVDEDD